ncbi:MAG: hypothetical protein M5U01_37250 [Ardenticatenaceae bacterium]|nr:hypothetical protein [Ardenticatenaceae bacterium]HBY98302.1 hypothetical protein [Chloroflexota bacterium]
MCTKARLVQADQVSEWFGMSHGGSAPVVDVPLEQGQAAFLEVSIDPAAHGPAGIGPIQRGVMVRTADGQELQFVLEATVTR